MISASPAGSPSRPKRPRRRVAESNAPTTDSAITASERVLTRRKRAVGSRNWGFSQDANVSHVHVTRIAVPLHSQSLSVLLRGNAPRPPCLADHDARSWFRSTSALKRKHVVLGFAATCDAVPNAIRNVTAWAEARREYRVDACRKQCTTAPF